MSVSNTDAGDTINDAITKLLNAYVSASATDKARLKYAANRLKEEYDAIRGRSPSASYREITGGISQAAGRLKTIAKDRERLATNMATAASILNTITKVLGLVGMKVS
ncbi:hypothetical protein [Agrobacterium larrymoorei]|uniref:Uncharacterized protein n=1 Tax=Agrobacterium larrymoorei TaxID=160699 RepID=A0A4D7DV09_9HYPH|nr:hypothetical protein [Agrobacterium larrymoorei]QCJ00872.1 hypothetical protein CFBP5473_22985 [Agrobacterium larrymoorei]QYA10207.1 hypothetical protein J5285_23655 [Agrobacterium larrymoorei]